MGVKFESSHLLALLNNYLQNLGVMLGVYLPTIQHILGVTMFIRLFWLVGIAGLAQTFLLLFVCCLCVSFPSILKIWRKDLKQHVM